MPFYKDLPNFKSMSASIDIAYKANDEFEELIDVYVGVCINDCKEPSFEEIQNVIGIFIGNGFFNFEELQLAMATLPGKIKVQRLVILLISMSVISGDSDILVKISRK